MLGAAPARTPLLGDRTTMLRYLPFLLVLALWIYAFVDCLNTPEENVRGLPKVVWVIIILLFGEVLLGPVAWLVAGKKREPADGGPTPSQPRRRTWVAPDDNPEFLRSLGTEKPAGREPGGKEPRDDEDRLRGWEADLRRREEEIRRREEGQEDAPPSS